MSYNNEMTLNFKSLSENEAFARACVASFCLPINPTMDEMNDIKTAVSEAVTNCVVHAYPKTVGEIVINVKLDGNNTTITIKDFGVGIDDVTKAREPFFTSKPDSERSGMGFTVMESFMDKITVESVKNGGTTVTLSKKLGVLSQVVGG